MRRVEANVGDHARAREVPFGERTPLGILGSDLPLVIRGRLAPSTPAEEEEAAWAWDRKPSSGRIVRCDYAHGSKPHGLECTLSIDFEKWEIAELPTGSVQQCSQRRLTRAALDQSQQADDASS